MTLQFLFKLGSNTTLKLWKATWQSAVSFLRKKYMLKVNIKNTKIRREYVQSHSRSLGVFIVNFEHISYQFLVFLLLT